MRLPWESAARDTGMGGRNRLQKIVIVSVTLFELPDVRLTVFKNSI